MLFALLSVAALCVLILLAGWVWYPNRMAKRGASSTPIVLRSSGRNAPVSIILATRESVDAIEQRVSNLLALDYTADDLEIIVALDLSRAPDASSIAARIGQRAVVVCASGPGKSSALNAGVAAARSKLLLFVDTAQTFEPDVLRRLVNVMEDQRWGAVTATLAATSGDALMDRYWQRELAIRVGQSARHSVICVTGCAYLMRRQYWRPMPASLICDDLWSTYSVVTSGGRVAIDTGASVSDPRRFTREQEFSRRLRTMTGMLQFVRWFPDVLKPGKNPMFLDFLLHKLVRPATPVLLLAIAVSAIGAVATWSSAWAVGLGLSGLAVAGIPLFLARVAPAPIRRRAETLLFTQRLVLMPLRAIFQAIRGDWDVWKPHR